jgi:type II secretion system protein H
MTFSIDNQSRNQPRRERGFTLIELILVMMLLIIMVTIVTPRLMGFFNGRKLDSEVRRFVSLTHYAQSRAVSDGVPMLLWVDPKAGTYGLQQESGYTSVDTKNSDDLKAETFTVAEGVKMNAGKAGSKNSGVMAKHSGFRFSPDGNTVKETSISGVSFQEGSFPPVWIMPSANGLSYEIQNDKNKIANAR